MISKVSIHNFKCLRDVTIDLERFTVFVGPNASGKSSILQRLDLLCRSFRQQLGSAESEFLTAMSRGATDHVELVAECRAKGFRYRTGSPTAPNRMTTPVQGGAQSPWSGEGFGVAPGFDAGNWKRWSANPNQLPLPLSVLLRLETTNLISPAPGSPDPTLMDPNGKGLHSALASMALNDPDSWQQLQDDLRRVVPSIRRLRHTTNQPPALLFDTRGADALFANQVSEGTLLVLGLLKALHSSSRPNLILLDDLDRGLHPRAQKELIALLRGLLATNAELQILATTHSPYMLDCMETNEVRMTILGDERGTVCAPLASHPQFDKWKDEMTPGEMWSLFGEKWLVEQEQEAAT